MRAVAYLLPWYMLAFPRAPFWGLALPCVGMVYACTGLAYLLSLVCRPPCSECQALDGCYAMHLQACPVSMAYP